MRWMTMLVNGFERIVLTIVSDHDNLTYYRLGQSGGPTDIHNYIAMHRAMPLVAKRTCCLSWPYEPNISVFVFICSLSCFSSDQPQLCGSEDIIVEEEAVLVLRCDIWANPAVSSVLWSLNGSEVDLIAGGFTLANDGFTSQLSANGAKKSLHAGTYQCTANSPVYGEHSKYYQVTVTGRFTQSVMPQFISVYNLKLY